jgi:DNA repair protein RadD
VAEGHLVPLKMYAAKAIDMAGAKVVAGEWAERDIEERGMKIVGDIVGEWVDKTTKHFGGPVKTIAFSATVDHGEELCKQFNAAGFNFQQISYRDANDERRRELIAEFRKENSEIHGLVSCEVFTKGFDVPDILCGVACRPYRKSFSSHIQQLGRVMRPARQAGRALALPFRQPLRLPRGHVRPLRERRARAGRRHRARQKGDARSRRRGEGAFACSCGFMLSPGMMRCPACGKERKRLSLVENVDGEMVALTHEEPKLPSYLADRDIGVAPALRPRARAQEGRRRGRAQVRARAVPEHLPRVAGARVHANNVEVPHPHARAQVQQGIIAWAKRRAA